MDLAASLSEQLLGQPQVTEKYMFGCPCFLVREKLFALVHDGNLVLTCLSPSSRETLLESGEHKIFTGGNKIKTWLELTVVDERTLSELLPYIEESKKAAAAKA
jgi:TfoX/Sxy family transcriptional regulator of competence genes